MDIFRIYPAVGLARVGNSESFVIAPESMAGTNVDGSRLAGDFRSGPERCPIRSGAATCATNTVR